MFTLAAAVVHVSISAMTASLVLHLLFNQDLVILFDRGLPSDPPGKPFKVTKFHVSIRLTRSKLSSRIHVPPTKM